MKVILCGLTNKPIEVVEPFPEIHVPRFGNGTEHWVRVQQANGVTRDEIPMPYGFLSVSPSPAGTWLYKRRDD